MIISIAAVTWIRAPRFEMPVRRLMVQSHFSSWAGAQTGAFDLC